MKKRDIIQLVKETIKEIGADSYGDATNLTKGLNVAKSRFTKTGRPPGVMEDEDLKEYTNMGQDGIYPKKEKPGDMFQQQAAEELMPNAIASRSDKAFQARLKQHAEWTEKSSYNNTFVHVQYNEGESNNSDDTYFIHQTQHFNSNYDDFRNPKFTELYLVKNKGKENEEYLGTYIVDTKAYIQDLKDLRKMGIIGDTVSEKMEKEYGAKISPEEFKSKMPVGKTVLYGGTKYKVLENDGYVLTLQSIESKNILKVNLGQFIDQGAIKETNMKKVKESKTKSYAGVDAIPSIEKDPRYGSLSGDTKADLKQKLKDGGAVELEEEPSEGNAFGLALQKAKELGEDTFEFDGKTYDVNEMHDEPKFTNDVGKDDYVDDEGRMAKSQMYKTGKYAMKLHDMLDDMEQLPAWVQAKLTKASDYLSAVYHYLDYEFARRDNNLMENMDKHRKRSKLMEGATEKLFKLFNAGKTDEDVRNHYLQMNVDMPESFIAKLRNNWEALRKTKLDLKLADQEAENFKSVQTTPVSGMEGEEDGMEEDKKLATGLFNETKTK